MSERRGKYNARKCKADGYTFDSAAEYRRYNELVLLERTGALSSLEVHPTFEIVASFEYNGKRERAVRYEADFGYIMLIDGKYQHVVEDVKGMRTDVYKLKRKLLLSLYGKTIWFREIEA